MKPQKRPQSSESAGAGGKKKAKQSDEPQQSGAASAATGAVWCSDCWARARSACRGAHWLAGVPTAHKHVVAEVAAALLRLDQAQARMQALMKSVLSRAPVLSAHVPEVMGRSCWSVDGGTVRIALASTVPLSAEDVQAVCEALEGLDLEYHREDGGLPHALVDMSGLEEVMVKLPEYATGQKCEEGDLLLDREGRLTVAKKDARSGAGAKLLGRLDKGDAGCLLGSSPCGDGSDCYVCQNTADDGTTFEEVRLVK